MNWTETTVGQLVDVKHGFAFKGKHFSDSGRYVVLTPGNCENSGGFKSRGDKEKWYSSDVPDGYLLDQGELLVVMTDLVNSAPVLGGSFMIPESDKYLHNQRLGLVKVLDEGATDKRFLYYLFNTHDYRGQVRGSASGATVRHTSPGRIKDCTVRIPADFEDQRRIASTLGAYDDLIENNKRRIVLLEEAARQLYKEWFVRFRFPGHEHVKIIDGVPEGWEHNALSDLADVIMGQSPKSQFYNQDGQGLPFHQGVTDYGFRFVMHRNYSTAVTKLAEPHDVLVSVRAPVGRINITQDQMVLGRGLAAIRSKTENQSFLFYALKEHFYAEDIIGTGAIYAATNKKELEAQLLLTPPPQMVESFEDVSRPIDRQIEVLSRSIERLTQGRDLLLPKLMSGSLAA